MEQRPQLQVLKIQTREPRAPKPDPDSHRPICFFCHQEVEPELLVLVNNTLEEMVCICSKHFSGHHHD